ncbi:diguanylate cyclase/phosphodiesterase (GGDEF & EAL domains) with PAS/PAC sensor(s) [Rhodovulum sp. P5]|uniref:putative bifunctional diguanylate cyclase/phosphodiesterase n=1 Tax=Rhodovulum sp. P5 TaxID=1564506 RepID=UPI0009C2A2E5|nr:EAL domain-containing protein [Rhodovulum sp. P5]ARE39190.1 diguanylate cyclase/phosphodiesterase (GGDEF & EAL domains) with PAS/PAC sensor(s) [Rhodovulum sp. P5]
MKRPLKTTASPARAVRDEGSKDDGPSVGDDPWSAVWPDFDTADLPPQPFRGDEAAKVELEVQKQELSDAVQDAERDVLRFRTFFEESPLAILILDSAGVVRMANRACAAVLGEIAPEKILNLSIYRLLEDEGSGRLFDFISSCGKADAPPAGTAPARVVTGLCPKGKQRAPSVLDAHLQRLPAGLGHKAKVQMVLVDRTDDSKRAESLFIQEAFIAGSPTLMHAVDLDGNLAWSNNLAKTELKAAAEEDEGQKIMQGMLGSRALDIEVLVSGKERSTQSTFVTPDGEKRSFLIQKFPILDGKGGNLAIGGISTDITALIEVQSALHRAFDEATILASRDPLTGLLNRSGFMGQLRDAVDAALKNGSNVMLGFLDIDGFKDINDAMGHEVGDGLLLAFARRLEEAVDGNGQIARFGGDEFLFFLTDHSPEEAEACLSRILDRIRTPYEIAGTQLLLTCSVGLSNLPADATTAEDLMRNADLAVYVSKSNGRDRITHFNEGMRTNSERRLRILSALRHALSHNNFRLVFQPKFSIREPGAVVGAEALLRWRDPKLGEVGPMEFVPIAELNGLSYALDLRVLKLFCAQQRHWMERGLALPISVNISAFSLHSASFVPTVLSLLEFNNIPPELLMLEITETAMMRFSSEIAERVQRLTENGVKISIDDFGTGYSSLAYLNELNPSELKIDRSFVASLGKPEKATERIIQAILALGHSLAIDVVAEGIETEAQRRWLADNGCSVGQGFLLSRPMEREDYERFVAERLAGHAPPRQAGR